MVRSGRASERPPGLSGNGSQGPRAADVELHRPDALKPYAGGGHPARDRRRVGRSWTPL